MNLFRSARLKLTLWYLLIIMLISFFFSLIIYRGVSFELERRFSSVERGMHRQMMRFHFQEPLVFPFLEEHLQAAKRRVLVILFYANGLILLLAGAAGYFLAGQTLEPIEKAMKEQERFVTDASHELRTPLTALKTTIEVALRDKKLNLKQARKVLEESLEEVDNLESLTSSLLTLAQASQTETRKVFSEVDLAQLAENAYQKIKSLAEKKGVTVEKELIKALYLGDKESLEKVILTLLDNAVKYTPAGGKVKIKTYPSSRSVVLEVSDTGVGILEEDLPRIFDRFYRADPSRSKVQVPGYGLGLPIAKKIVQAHQGKIEVKSRVSQGTTFRVVFPVKSV